MTRHDTPDNMRRRLFDAALSVCAEKGYGATRMDDIAREAGRSKGSLYHHFESKSHLFLEMFDDFLTRMSAEVEAGLAGEQSAGSLLRGIITQFADVLLADPRHGKVWVEFMVLALRDEPIRTRLRVYYETAITAFAELFAWGVASGEFRSDLDTRATAEAFAMATDGLFIMYAVMRDDPNDALAGMDVLATSFLEGVSSRGAAS